MADEAIDLEAARLTPSFRCFVCEGQAEALLSVRLSQWHTGPPSFEVGAARYELRTRFVCLDCFASFVFEPMFAHGFYMYGGRTFRLSTVKAPARYDLRKWLQYVRRHGDGALR